MCFHEIFISPLFFGKFEAFSLPIYIPPTTAQSEMGLKLRCIVLLLRRRAGVKNFPNKKFLRKILSMLPHV